MQQHPNNSTQTDEDSYLKNPLPENEHVGVDEEVMYLTNVPPGAENVLICVAEEEQDEGNPAKEKQDEGEDGSDSDKSEEEGKDEDADVDEPKHLPNVQYDQMILQWQ